MVKNKQSILPIILVIFLIIILLIVGTTPPDHSNKKVQETKQDYSFPEIRTAQLTQSLKDEICREMEIWTEYCYDTGIKLSPCAAQFNEKVMRLYEISPHQLMSVLEYCAAGTPPVDKSYKELQEQWDATTGMN